MLASADGNFGCEGEVDDAHQRDIVQHVPGLVRGGEAVFHIDVGNAASAALLVEEGAETAFLLQRAFLHQRNPLVRIDKVSVLLKQQIVSLTDDAGAVLCRDHLDIESEVAVEAVLHLIHDVQNLCRELHRLVGIALASEFVGIDEPKEIHDLVHADATDGAELLVQLHGAVLIVREKPFLDVAPDDVPHGGERLAVQLHAPAEDLEILLFVHFTLVGDADEVNRGNPAGADGQRRAADGVNEGVQLAGVGKQTAAVTQHADIVAAEEVGVVPVDIVVGAPSGEWFVHKDIPFACADHFLRLFLGDVSATQQRIGQHRIGEHVHGADFADHFHEDLLTFDQVFNVVDGEGAVRKFHAAEEGLQIVVVEDRNIRKRCLVNSQERLVKPVDELLELLTEIVVGVLHVVSVFHVLLPEVPRPDQDVRHADGTALTVAEEAYELDHIVKICSQMARRLVVVVGEEEEAFGGEPGEVVRPAVGEVAGRGGIVQIEGSGKFRLQPHLGRTQTVHLLDLQKDFVQAEDLVLALPLFRHERTDILVVRVGVGVNAGVRQRVLIDEIVDELGEVELARMKPVKVLEVFSVLLFQVFETAFEVLVQSELNFHFLLLFDCLFAEPGHGGGEVHHPPVHAERRGGLQTECRHLFDIRVFRIRNPGGLQLLFQNRALGAASRI